MGFIYFITLISVWAVVIANAYMKNAKNPCLIDAALYSTETKDIYFFKDEQYARWNTVTDSMYNYGLIEDLFHKVKGPIDATVEYSWGSDRKTYFIKGSQMLEYSFAYNTVVDDTLTIEKFAKGLRGPIDASAYYNDELYFFSGQNYQIVSNPGGQGDRIATPPKPIKDKFPDLDTPINAATYRALAQDKKSSYIFSGPTHYHQLHPDGSTTRLAIATWWPGLIESPLFHECGCTCDEVEINSDEWRLDNIDYSGLLSAYHPVDNGEYIPEITDEKTILKFNFMFTDYFKFNLLVFLCQLKPTSSPHRILSQILAKKDFCGDIQPSMPCICQDERLIGKLGQCCIRLLLDHVLLG